MRQRFAITLAAGKRWPDAIQGQRLPPFNWVKVDNRGSNAVDVGLNPMPTAGDHIDTLLTVGSGKVRVFNVGGQTNGGPDDPSNAWPTQLHLVSASGTDVVIEIADHTIVDMTFAT